MILNVDDKLKRKFWEYISYEECINIHIIGYAESYGFESEFHNIWIQTDNDENICAVMLRFHKSLIVYSYENNYDIYELILHIGDLDIEIISGKKIVIDRLISKYYKYEDKSEYDFCILNKLNNLEFENQKRFKLEEAKEKDLKGIYNLLKKNSRFEVDNYIDSKAHQLQTKTGRIYFVKEGSKIISTCCISIENDFLAMIDESMTDDEFLDTNVGMFVLYNISKNLIQEGKCPCLFSDRVNYKKIYSEMGYKVKDSWLILSIK